MFDSTKAGCDAADIPDAPARALRDFRGQVQILISHFVNRRLVGPRFTRLTHPCAVVMASAESPSPDTFADRQWIASVYTQDGKNIAALVHDEYQGHLHDRRCRSQVYRLCWYNAITYAVSRDGGRSYRQPRPPTQLVASIPQRYRPDAGPAGMFGPSNIVRNPADGYFYALVRVIGYGGSPRGTCVIRTRTFVDPRSWRAWDGVGFSLRMPDPYQARRQDLRFCAPVDRADISEMSESLTYNTALRAFLLVGMSTALAPDGRPMTGIYYSVSYDLTTWSHRRLLLEVPTVNTFQCGGPEPIAYPSVIDPSSTSRSYETSGSQPYLYFTRFDYHDCRQTLHRQLWRIPITVTQQP